MTQRRALTTSTVAVLLAAVLWSNVGRADGVVPVRVGSAGRCADALDSSSMGTPSVGSATPTLDAATLVVTGRDASAALSEEIGLAVQHYFDCIATGNPSRILALSSRRQSVSSENSGLMESSESSGTVAMPTVVNSFGPVLYAGPWGVRQLDDGRVSAFVWLASESDNGMDFQPVVWVFSREEGQWRLDQVVEEVVIVGRKKPVPIGAAFDLPSVMSLDQ